MEKLKPKKELKRFEINTEDYDGKEQIVIDFKDGTSLPLNRIEQMFREQGTASETFLGKETADKILKFLQNNNPTRKEFVEHFKSTDLNQGGAIMEQQMEMAFMQEGGMQDDGGKVEPTSGNEVPSGSLEDEVKDDIPAMLSEGEFVFPADVVRFIGLSNLMKMRQDAKQGLKMMEKMGQLGNPEEAEMPDDVPFEMADLVVVTGEMKEEDKEEKAEGGVVGLQTGGLLNDPRFASQTTAGTQPTEYTEEEKQEIKDALEGTPTRGQVTLKKIVNPDNPEDFEMHPYDGDEPMFPLPEGYVLDDTPIEQQMDTRAASSGTPQQEERSKREREDGSATITPMEVSQSTEEMHRELTSEGKIKSDDEYVLYDSTGRPMKLQKSIYEGLIGEYEGFDPTVREEMTFAQYYNLPFIDKVTMGASKLFGQPLSADEVKGLIKDAGEGKLKGNPLALPFQKLVRKLTNAAKAGSPRKDSQLSETERAAKEERKRIADVRKRQDELLGVSKTKGERLATPITSKQLEEFQTSRADTDPSLLGTTKLDPYLSGLGRTATSSFADPRDPTGKTMINKGDPIIRSTFRDPKTNKTVFQDTALTQDSLKGITDNERIVREQAIADARKRAGFDQTGRERKDKTVMDKAAERVASQRDQEEQRQDVAGRSGFDMMFGGNKGGMAKPKAKPKRMKKGGLASKKKK